MFAKCEHVIIMHTGDMFAKCGKMSLCCTPVLFKAKGGGSIKVRRDVAPQPLRRVVLANANGERATACCIIAVPVVCAFIVPTHNPLCTRLNVKVKYTDDYGFRVPPKETDSRLLASASACDGCYSLFSVSLSAWQQHPAWPPLIYR